jgi:hypothetical protein
MPAIEIEAIIPTAEEELRPFQRRCVVGGNANLVHRHRLRRGCEEKA